MKVGVRLPKVLHFDETLTTTCLDYQVKNMLIHMKGNWVNKKLIRIVLDGTSNSSFAYHTTENADDVIVFRIYGAKSELLIDRELELESFQILLTNQLAPSIICTFQNGYCYEFVPGKPISVNDLKQDELLRETAYLVARIHSIKTPSSFLENCKRVGTVFDHIEKFLSLLPTNHFEVNKGRYSAVSSTISTEILQREMAELMKSVAENMLVDNDDVSLVFCHNDINCANLIYNKVTDKLSCIDYEYACVNYADYDIANFFCEFAGSCDMDFAKYYPNKETQVKWIKHYLEKKYELTGRGEENISEKEVDHMYRQINVFALASHLLWGSWAIVQSEISNIEFDFIAYAVIRLSEYFEKKDVFLALLKNES